jgi:hypothetical protein
MGNLGYFFMAIDVDVDTCLLCYFFKDDFFRFVPFSLSQCRFSSENLRGYVLLLC